MTPESCGGETSTSANGNSMAALAAPKRSAHRNDDLWYRVRRAPHLSQLRAELGVFELAEGAGQSTLASSSYFEGQDVLMTEASST